MGEATTAAARAPRRPFGLNAIIVIQLLLVLFSATLLALAGLVVWLSYTYAQESLLIKLDLSFDELVTLVVMFVVNLVCAVGLWRRRRWAWFLTMFQLGVFMVSDLHSYFTGAAPEAYAWSMLLNVLMVFYLNQREVQTMFMAKSHQQHTTDPADASVAS
jgi:hypothetical protein